MPVRWQLSHGFKIRLLWAEATTVAPGMSCQPTVDLAQMLHSFFTLNSTCSPE